MKLDGRLWITRNGKNLAGQGRIELLAHIAESGSITQAAKAMGMSYKAAWDAVDAMNNAAGSALVQRSVGGKGGGGTRLTEAGQQLIESYRRYQEEHRRFLERLGEDLQLESLLQLMERLNLRSSARNQLAGQVLSVQAEGLNDRVEFQLAGGQVLHALITHASTARLGLEAGAQLCALIKAPWVHLLAADAASGNGDNRLHGHLAELHADAEHTEAVVELDGGGQLVAVLSTAQAQGLQEGQAVQLLIDAEQIILCA
ncbi:TOBE domain-containing protein [Pseudomonas sp. BMS12]|uniref:TOBE domain-containing protein n=1 Tax=Pseudomonas sp. BMS12 TaxID=1796033 RepID=UPI00083B5290|nr:TOBE domain-containing protein [Pseudomonas sp. BMS12]